MKLSEKSEEILEALWVAVEEEGAAFLDPEKLGFPVDDPAYVELTGHAMIEIRQGMIYFRPEGLNEGADVKVCTMLNHPTTCPHGKPIPPGECCHRAKADGDLGVVPLTEFKSGQEGEIAYIQTDDNKKMQKLMAMGVLPGNKIVLVQAYPSYIFRVGYSEFAIDTNLAKEIFVRK